MKIIASLVLILSLSSLANSCFADGSLSYNLKPQKVAQDTYVLFGDLDFFTPQNGGNIHNSGFIITDKGVVVIDSGPSKLYGAQMLAAIQKITSRKVTHLILTHHHPDHAFGSQAFVKANKELKIIALAATEKGLETQGDAFLDNLYRLAGERLLSTELTLANTVIDPQDQPTVLDMGNHKIQLRGFSGHSDGDLVIQDLSTGVLFSGDLVFNQRAPATPHANLKNWQTSLAALKSLLDQTPILIPGHGPIKNKQTAAQTPKQNSLFMLDQTSGYLSWLEQTISNSVENGSSMVEAMREPLPAKYKSWGAMPSEYQRSIVHLYPLFEEQVFAPLN